MIEGSNYQRRLIYEDWKPSAEYLPKFAYKRKTNKAAPTYNECVDFNIDDGYESKRLKPNN